MLILFMLFLIVAVAFILAIRRNKETVYLLFLCLSLALYLFGIMLYIAKKGGINRELQRFLFLSDTVKSSLQYYLITLDRLGIIIAVGRVLFPSVLLLIALEFSMVKVIRGNYRLKILTLVIPTITMFFYQPKVFRVMAEKYVYFQRFMVQFSYLWIMGYIIVALIILVYEYKSFKFKFWKRYFLHITIFIASLSVIFSLYAKQDPSQVYYFYGDSYLSSRGIYYMKSILPVKTYIIIVGVNVTFAVAGLFSFYQYSRSQIRNHKEALMMQRNFDMASIVGSAFVHSTKNQLLSNKIIYKRMRKSLNEDKVNLEDLSTNVGTLIAINDKLLERIDELYEAVKTKSIQMVPTSSKELFEKTLSMFNSKYPKNSVQVEGQDIMLMIDLNSMDEVLYNLLSNAEDAVRLKHKEDGEGEIIMTIYQERLYSVIEIKDNGPGMVAEQKTKIFEPFYSSKNSNFNWGMGLHYSREIVKGHYGTIRFDTIEGEGTTFYVLIPRY